MNDLFVAKQALLCRTCGDALPCTFYKLSGTGRPQCHSCKSEYNRQWRANAEPQQPLPEKVFPGCGQELPSSFLSAERSHPTGLASHCHGCKVASNM